MLNPIEKISLLENCLNETETNYADSFKNDISIYLGSFDIQNSNLNFLNNLSSKAEIENWVSKLTSRIVLKYNQECEQLSEFIFDYITNG